MTARESISRDKCGQRFPAEDGVTHGGRTVCEDCAMDLLSPAKACDPWAVRMASGSFQTKADAVATLRGLERQLYDCVRERGRLPIEDLPEILATSQAEASRAMATLRHMELICGDRREDGGADCVLFDS